MTFEYGEDSKEINFYMGSFRMFRDKLFQECFEK